MLIQDALLLRGLIICSIITEALAGQVRSLWSLSLSDGLLDGLVLAEEFLREVVV